MTRERAIRVSMLQSQFPYWGNYRKFMTEEEIAFVENEVRIAPSGNVSFASVVSRIARGL